MTATGPPVPARAGSVPAGHGADLMQARSPPVPARSPPVPARFPPVSARCWLGSRWCLLGAGWFRRCLLGAGSCLPRSNIIESQGINQNRLPRAPIASKQCLISWLPPLPRTLRVHLCAILVQLLQRVIRHIITTG